MTTENNGNHIEDKFQYLTYFTILWTALQNLKTEVRPL